MGSRRADGHRHGMYGHAGLSAGAVEARVVSLHNELGVPLEVLLHPSGVAKPAAARTRTGKVLRVQVEPTPGAPRSPSLTWHVADVVAPVTSTAERVITHTVLIHRRQTPSPGSSQIRR